MGGAYEKLAEKIVEKIKEVIRLVSTCPSFNIDTIMSLQPAPIPIPTATYSFPFSVSLRISSLISYLPYIDISKVVSNPDFPSPSLIYELLLDLLGMCEAGRKPSISMSIVSEPTLPSPTEGHILIPSIEVRKNP